MLIILHKINGWYHAVDRKPNSANLLAKFLTDDVGNYADEYISEFEDNQEYAAAMNATQYTKNEGFVIITPEWVMDEDESIAKGNFIKIKALVLAKLLRQWKEVYGKKPPYIVITIENGVPLVVGLDNLAQKLDENI